MNMIKIHILKFLLVISYIVYARATRTISCSVNPGLDDTYLEKSSTNVVHIIAEGEQDTVHFVWSTYKFPSVIVARTTKNTTLMINSTKLISFEKDAILFENGKPLESIGVTFSKLWELHYDNDSSLIKDVVSDEDLNMESFHWSGVNETLNCSSSFASVVLKGSSSEMLFSKDGTLQILFSVSGDQKLSDEFPHLVFTGNSTLLKFVFDNFYSNYSHSRYGFEITLFSVLSDKCERNKWQEITSKSINDEVSPGVFSDVELLAPCSDPTQKKSSFLSWRPVAYTGEKPIVANSSDVTITTDILPSPLPEDILSIAQLYFEDKSNASVFNITFGTSGDGFYEATKYTSWTLMIGTGTMLETPLSTLVIILAAVGVGLLILFFATGSVFILYRKCKDRDDDLLLN